MRMRSSSTDERTVQIPMPYAIGRPEGAPPPDELRPGVIDGQPVRPDKTKGNRFGDPNIVANGDGGYRRDKSTFRVHIRRDGSVKIQDVGSAGIDGASGLGLSGHFDLTDMLMRAHGEDPYRYEKEKILNETREERAKMAIADRAERLREAVHKMPDYLTKVWGHAGWSDAQRRQLLFLLWDEVAESGDDEVVHAGVEVRRTIEAFIREHLPAGGPRAYTDEELRALNETRTAHERFAPYQ
jgi:hypothetical protein